MGCDYYIYKSLEIDFHYSINPTFIQLSMERGYFYELNLDEDHSYYEEKYRDMIEEQLNKCKKEWKDIRKIMKVEHRSERD